MTKALFIFLLVLFGTSAHADSGKYCNLPRAGNWAFVSFALEDATHKKCETITAADLAKVTELKIVNEPLQGNLKDLTNLKKLTLVAESNGGHGLGEGAFDGADNLETIVITGHAPGFYFDIGSNAFRNLSKLKTLRLQTGQTFNGRIASDAFLGLNSIQTIDFQSFCDMPNPLPYPEYWNPYNYVWYVQKDWSRGIDPQRIRINPGCVRPL